MAVEENLLFLALTETHLTYEHLNAEINMNHYSVYRADRQGRSHGGVANYIREDIAASAEVLTSFSNGTTELLVVFMKSINLLAITLYRPPNTTHGTFRQITQKIEQILSTLPNPNTEVIMSGDFNFPNINWPEMKTTGGTPDDKQQACDLIRVVENYFLFQLVTDPTRERNILDLIFSNNPNLLHSYEISDTIMSDHKLIKVKASISTTTTPISHVQNSTAEGTLSDLNFYSTEIEWEQLRTKLGEIDWINTMQGKDIDNILSLLTKICYETCKKHIPKKRTNTSKIPRDRKIIMIKRHKLQTKLKNTTYPPVRVQITEKLRELEEQMQKSHKEQQRKEEMQAVSNIQQNSKFFFAYARKKLKSGATVGPLTKEDGTLTGDTTEMADLLKSQYESVFSRPRTDRTTGDPLSLFDDRPNDQLTLSSINITKEDIVIAIDNIAPDSTAGPDGFHAQLLKKCKLELATPLQSLWSTSLENGTVPSALKVNNNQRRGRLCYVKGTQGTTQKVKSLIHNSFTYNGTRLFNCIPQQLRDLTGVSPETFKRKLDQWLQKLPDCPPTPGYPNSNQNTLPQITREAGGLEYTGASGGRP
ncbi:hypothetical protein Pmani_003961 [Petrolisthes manimaculis]|uniref:Endonuclease/exonuclease/phosphatase domain-containing protein n=1 Tax=Petrolisthes manimaculis TaxID=1843537 RepID=A0AAE1QFN0_9EUCA|nr:hypothetical protein Pmani_003961 [Petrolisthes manimaculis]